MGIEFQDSNKEMSIVAYKTSNSRAASVHVKRSGSQFSLIEKLILFFHGEEVSERLVPMALSTQSFCPYGNDFSTFSLVCESKSAFSHSEYTDR